MVWVRKDQGPLKTSSPSPPKHASPKKAVPQEPTWRKVTSKLNPQVATQEPAPKDKGKGKIVDVTYLASNSTSMTFLPRPLQIARVSKPKVATQEPALVKVPSFNKKAQQDRTKIVTQEPTSAMEVVTQEPVLPHSDAMVQKPAANDIIHNTKAALKDLAQSVLATTSQMQLPPSVAVSASRYATWFFNALP